MWTVKRPQFEAGNTFRICISRVRNAGLRRRLAAIYPDIVAAADDYEQKAETRGLHAIPTATSVAGLVSKEEMGVVYDKRMASKGSPGRFIYDRIKLLPAGDRCPFCDQRNVSTIDHILPKALYPSLSVTPLNLVGACFECNKIKLSLSPATPEDVVLHPYFDDITNDRWLVADVIQQSPCAINFDINRPVSWTDLTAARVEKQFDLLDLASLYASEAGRELANIRYNLKTHFDAGGAAAVQHELLRQWHSRRANRLNSWQTAMYDAVAHNAWFCDGGFG